MTKTVKISINFLGLPSLIINEQPVVLPTQKITGLVYYLFYETEALRSHLATMFWEDKDMNLASGNLRNALYLVKKLIPESVFLIDRKTIRLSPEIAVQRDLDELENLSHCSLALARKLGAEFLAGLEFEGEGFNDWLSRKRRELGEAYAARLDQRIKYRLQAGKYEDAVQCLKMLMAMDNLDERNYLRLMEVYADQGQTSKAVKLYAALRRILADELDAAPCREVEDFYRKILSAKEEKKPAVEAMAPAGLFGRDREIEAVLSHISQNIGERNIYVSISGPAGIGKSTLVNHLLPRLSQARPLWCRAHEVSTKYPYSPWNSFFRDLSRDLNPAEVKDQLKAHILKTRFPSFGLNFHLPDSTDFSLLLEPQNPIELGGLLAETISSLTSAERRVVVLEDFQWFDQDSTEMLLNFLLSASNLLVITLYRTGDGGGGRGYSILERIAQESAARIGRIRLEPFSYENTALFFSQKLHRLLSDREKDLIYAETEGIPLYLSEMLNILKEGREISDSSERLPGLIESRLSGLTDKQRLILEFMSAFTAEVFYADFISLFKTMGAGENEMLLLSEDIEVLCRKGFISERLSTSNNLKLSFSHERIKFYVYSQMGEFRRRSLHAKIASILEQMAMKNVWDRALEDETIFHHHKSANDPAALCFQLLRLRRHVIINHELFPVIEDNDLRLCGLPFSTREMTEKLLTEAEISLSELKSHYPPGEELNRAAALYQETSGSYNIYYGNYRDGAYAVEQALKYAVARKEAYMAMRCLQQLALMGIQQECPAAITANARPLLESARENKNGLFEAAALRFLGVSRQIEGRAEEAGELFEQSYTQLRSLARSGECYTLNTLAAKNYLGELHHRRGEMQMALDCFEECLEECGREKLFWGRPLFGSNIAYVAISIQAYDQAESHINEAIRLFETTPSGRRNSMAYSLKAYLEARKGNVEEALEYLRTGDDLCGPIQKKSWMALQLWVKYNLKKMGLSGGAGEKPDLLSKSGQEYRALSLELFKAIHFDPEVLNWQ